MRNLHALSLPALLVTGLMLIPAPDAAAHEVVYTDYRGRPAVHVVHRRAILPPWLRHDRDFSNWYSLNYGYFAVDLSWNRLYRSYQHDDYYHRHYKARHYRDRHYQDRHYKDRHYKDRHYKARYKAKPEKRHYERDRHQRNGHKSRR
jgi:hypothetical protein